MATLKRQMKLYRTELDRIGKHFPNVLPAIKEIFCAKDTATALEMAGSYLASKYKTYAAWGQDDVLPGEETFHQTFEDLLKDRFIRHCSSPSESWRAPACLM